MNWEAIKKEINLLGDEVVKLRRDIHMHPELGFEEFRTAKVISDYLQELGIEVQSMARTGVVGLLKGDKPGPTVLLRADMDALPLQEMCDVPYKSKYDGKAHACGHDAHVAMLMVAAKVLCKLRYGIAGGSIKFAFQPNEETAGAPESGGLEMIKAGVLENPSVDGAFALHLWTGIGSGKIGIVNGPIMAGNEEFELTIHGRGGHTSSPQNAVDPIAAAIKIIEAAQNIPTREVNVLNPTLIMFGKIHGGTGRNIIPEKVELGGTIRYLFEDEDREKEELKGKFERVIKGICVTMRTDYDLQYIPSNPSIVNDSQMVELVKGAARETLGNEQDIIVHRLMAGDDFGEFARRVPSAFYFVGTGNKNKGTDFPHHHPLFNIDEDTLLTGVEMHVRSALTFLNK